MSPKTIVGNFDLYLWYATWAVLHTRVFFPLQYDNYFAVCYLFTSLSKCD